MIENTANESFLRQSFGEGTPVQLLLRNPIEHDHIPETPLPKPFIQDPDEYAEMNPFVNESDVDFSRPEQQRAMEDALRSARSQFGQKYPAIIENHPVETAEWFDSLNPSKPGEVVGRTALCDTRAVDRAVAAASKALQQWAGTPMEQMANVLDRAADILHDRRFQAAAVAGVRWSGRPGGEAHGDIQEAVDYLRFYAHDARRLASRPRRRDYPGETNEYFYAPRGVVAVISPFCFPMALLTGMTAAAVVMGNTVLVKPATSASVCGAQIANILIEAGLPAGVLNFIPGRGEQIGEHLIKHPGIHMIAFTGSREVGCHIIENARHAYKGQTAFKHVIADMGAKNAIIVDDDADIDEAVQATIASAFHYSGQKCTACTRAIVLSNAYNDYLAKLVEAAAGIKPASAELPGTTVGPLVDGDALDRAYRFIEAGKKEAKCVLGGDQPRAKAGKSSTEPYFLSPVIFAEVPPDSKLAQEEVLAPVLAVIRAESFEQAVDIANGTAYALTGGVFSRSPRNIEMAKARLEVGCLYVNRKITVSRVDRQPFGGFKMSGLGTKTGGPDYLQQYAIPRTISENTMRHGFSPATGTAKPSDRSAAPEKTHA